MGREGGREGRKRPLPARCRINQFGSPSGRSLHALSEREGQTTLLVRPFARSLDTAGLAAACGGGGGGGGDKAAKGADGHGESSEIWMKYAQPCSAAPYLEIKYQGGVPGLDCTNHLKAILA